MSPGIVDPPAIKEATTWWRLHRTEGQQQIRDLLSYLTLLTEVYPGEKGDGENHELTGLK